MDLGRLNFGLFVYHSRSGANIRPSICGGPLVLVDRTLSVGTPEFINVTDFGVAQAVEAYLWT